MNGRSTDEPIGYFGFVQRVLIVVYGVLLATVPTTIIAEGFASPYSLLLLTLLLLFTEAYIVLHTYHGRLREPYDVSLMVSDLLLVGIYVFVVRLLQEAPTHSSLFDTAMVLGVIAFLLLFVRQVGPYRSVEPAELEAAGITKVELLIPMTADFAGVGACAVLLAIHLLGQPLGVWALAAFGGAITYFVFKYLVVVRVSFGRPT